MDKIEQICREIQKSSNGLAFTGAGVSAPSGIKTFRGSDGIWKEKDPEELASPRGFKKNPQMVWDWYNARRRKIGKVEPNAAHKALKTLEKYFDKFWVVTQNVDNLHREAGSGEVIELHGNIFRNKCNSCGRIINEDIESDKVVKCEECGGLIRPDVVWFGEPLPEDAIEKARDRAVQCDICFIVGTSAMVQPASSIPLVARENGALTVEINRERTVISDYVDVSLSGDAAEILPAVLEKMENVR